MDSAYTLSLSQKEVGFLRMLASGDRSFPSSLKLPSAISERKITIQLRQSEAEEIREYLTNRLAMVGFDENYNPNEEGRILEELIDTFAQKP